MLLKTTSNHELFSTLHPPPPESWVSGKGLAFTLTGSNCNVSQHETKKRPTDVETSQKHKTLI